MITITEKKSCCGCSSCVQVCPRNCIAMKSDSEGFLYPSVSAELCIHCGKCEKVCPVVNSASETGQLPEAWAVVSKNEQVRLQSSSGGVFSLLAEHILNQGGVVFGAAFCESFGVEHIAVTSKEELMLLRGSKYVQSRIGTTFQQVKEHLNAGRQVLFCGTPCQTEGLKNYLSGKREGLLLVDIICHGVPSPRVWKKYVQFREEKNNSEVGKIFFRNKKTGWKNYSVSFTFKDGREFLFPADSDPFMQAFLTNCCLRPSCGSCAFKKLARSSDLTLADFWGIEKLLPSMDDDKGTSLVFTHSDTGRKVLQQISDRCSTTPVDTRAALEGNPSMTSSSVFHRNRAAFFEKLDVLPFNELVQKYASRPFSVRSCLAGILRRGGLLEAVRAIKKSLRG